MMIPILLIIIILTMTLLYNNNDDDNDDENTNIDIVHMNNYINDDNNKINKRCINNINTFNHRMEQS